VKDRSFCQWDETATLTQQHIENEDEGWVPITQQECENPTDTKRNAPGKWVTVPAWGIPPPECVRASFTRDNHLGNAVPADPDAHTDGSPNYYNWTIPADFSTNCVLRLRYNISTGEFPNQGFSSDWEVTPGAGMDRSSNMRPLNPNNPDRNARYPSMFDMWTRYGLSMRDNNGSFTKRVQDDDPDDDDDPETGRLGGVRKAQPPSRDYTLRNNPQVDIFGPLLARNVSSDAGYNGQPMIRLRLAIDTAQYGRTFQDRTHSFEIRRRSPQLLNRKIWNLSVRGKKGNIVQVYPGVEYDFVPERLTISQGDVVHVQWTGSSPQDGEGAGNNGDRNNLIMMAPHTYDESGYRNNTSGEMGHWGRNYPTLINDTSLYPAFLGLDFVSLRALALYGLNSSHFDLGPVQAITTGQYRYMCTRNNAFSNRSQKGVLTVLANETWIGLGAAGVMPPLPASVNIAGEVWSESGRARLYQSNYESRDANGNFDGSFVVPGQVTVQDTNLKEWFYLSPGYSDLGVVDGQALYLEIERPDKGNFFYKGQLNWKLYPNDTLQELIPMSNFYAAKNKYAVQNGGYYQSTSVPNTAMIAGVSIGLVAVISIFVFLYWKVRVQPVGGWKVFCNQNKEKEKDEDGFGTELIQSSAASSSPKPSSQV
jgi:hypothetical protein